MTNVFCPMIELGAIIPGVVLAYLPIKKHLKLSKLRLFPVMILSLVCLCTLCWFCLLQIQSEIVCACNTDSACPFGSILLFTQNIHVEIGECVTCGMRSVCLHCEHYTGG